MRSINNIGRESEWGAPQSFQVVAADLSTVAGVPETMLTRLSVADVTSLADDQVTVSQLPVTVVETPETAEQATAPIAEVVQNRISAMLEQASALPETDGAELDSGDNLMANWDNAIWAEESASVAQAEVSLEAETVEPPSAAGWLAGLAAFTPGLLRRRNRKKN